MSNVELLHVYVLEDENGYIKIGIAGNVSKRISSINTNSAYEITNQYESPSCTNARKIEKAAHKHFVDNRKKGEWFSVPFDDAVDFVKRHFVDTTQQLVLLNTGQTQIEVTINSTQMPILVYNNKRVVTFALIDTVHKRPEGTAKRNFNVNRKHFVKGDDFFELTADEIRTQSLSNVFSPRTPKGILLTQFGYLMVVKSLKDDLAWQVQRQLVERYFVQSQTFTVSPEIETYITARVRDEVTNALAKTVELEVSSTFVNQGGMDDWSNTIIDYLRNKNATTITLILTDCLCLKTRKKNRNMVADILRKIGWKQAGRIKIDGESKRGWISAE